MASTETCSLLTKNFDETGDISETCKVLGSDIINQKLSVLKLVQDLGPYLISTDINLRHRGTSAFAKILQNLPEDFLSEKELNFIAIFFSDRIKDHHSVVPAVLQGILVVVKMKNIPSDACVLLASSLFSNVVCYTQVQSDRLIYYQILHTLITKRSKDLQSMSSEFVHGVISAMDGERDPRNLMFLFHMLPEFLRSFPLGQLTEDTFEVIGCYFPVDFTPASSDTRAITREDLANSLLPCLTAIPAFGEFCIPLILEKLDSDLRQAKIDSLVLLREGCFVWNKETLSKYYKELWPHIKKELLPATDVQLQELCCSALKALLAKLLDTDAIRFVSDIMLSCEGLLEDTQLSLFEPALKLLLTTAQASELTCKSVVTKIFPFLLSLQKVNGNSDSVIVISAFILFLETCLEKKLDLFSEGSALSEVWSDIVQVFLCGTQNTNVEVRKSSFHAFTVLASQIHNEVTAQLCTIILASVVSEESVDLRKEVMECMAALARKNSGEVERIILPELIIKKDEEINLQVQQWRYEALCFLAARRFFIDDMAQQFTYLVSTCTQLTHVALKCLRDTVYKAEPAHKEFVEHLTQKCNIIQFLISWWLQHVVNDNPLFSNEEHLVDVSRIIDALVRPLSSAVQMSVVEPVLEMFMSKCNNGENGQNLLNVNSSSRYTQMVSLLEALIGSLRPDVNIATKRNLDDTVLPLAVHSNHMLTRMSAMRLLASIINKLQPDEALTAVLNRLEEYIKHVLSTENTNIQKNAALLHVYVTKALVLRGHNSMHHWLDKLIELIEDSHVGEIAAGGFHIIMRESDWYLNYASNSNIRLLYRQRLFMVVPKIVANYGSSQTQNKTHYLTALAHIIQEVPHIVLVPHLPQILPMLVQSLSAESSEELTLITLSTLLSLLTAKESVLEQYIDTFIPRFLSISHTCKYMKVRIAALKCLFRYLDYSPILLLPYKQRVIRELETCLDDKKRLVRQEAARTRSCWYLLGAPTPET